LATSGLLFSIVAALNTLEVSSASSKLIGRVTRLLCRKIETVNPARRIAEMLVAAGNVPTPHAPSSSR
jgi:hypothetical protein